MAVSKQAKEIYNALFDGVETWVANQILVVQEWRKMKHYMANRPVPAAYSKAYKAYWGKYGHYSPQWGWYYASKNGNDDVRYVPNTLYFTRIDQHFNARKLGWGFNDKNYYSLIFSQVKQPDTLLRKIGSELVDAQYHTVTVEQALALLDTRAEVIMKPTQDTGSGRGISFFSTAKDRETIESILRDRKEKNLIFQAVMKQHPSLAAIYPTALNTIRVTTLLLNGKVHILSAVMRMGANGNRVDNASGGGVSVGIDENGRLKAQGHILYAGDGVDRHPDGFVFSGFEVPRYQQIIAAVKELAQGLGNFRLVSWDMSVDEQDEVVLIEANMRKGGIAIHQFNNGPLFGELTDEVLREVFGN